MTDWKDDEANHLEQVQGKLQVALTNITTKVEDYYNEILEIKRYMYDNASQLDHAEKAANRVAVSDGVAFGEKAVREREKIEKLIKSPYFGRIDFSEIETDDEEIFYIGVHSFIDIGTLSPIIFDWRAPVSSMFYDFEIGDAFYIAPMGRIEGVLNRKRQYKIKNSQMEYAIESSLNIDDDILQKELSQNSDDKMKNIVATIQREQNAIIRNEKAKVLIIQGAAGSGKTSIALHRVAFLLYRYKETLNSNNIAIISPNRVFGNYISNVLPELGEENILEFSVENIAATMLGNKFKHESFSQQVESLLITEDEQAINRIKFKATNEFVLQLQAYLDYASKKYFTPADIAVEDFYVSKTELLLSYLAGKNRPIKTRLRKMAENLISKYKRQTGKKLSTAANRKIRRSIEDMFSFSDAFALYKNFYRYIEQEQLFRMTAKSTLEFCDVYPLLYVKMFFEDNESAYKRIEHLIIDEMQDYSPIQYAVISKMFSCKMTILGDSYQSVNPYSSSSAQKIEPYFEGCSCAELCKSYRSTIEITRFTQRILENEKLIPIERHGEPPTITSCENQTEQTENIRHMIERFEKSENLSLGIICKTQQQADILFKELHDSNKNISLLGFESEVFQEGIIVTSVHMSKGLEFDQVIVPNISKDIYKTQLDRSLLYIACTRAMHKLDLLCCGEVTTFLA